MKEPAPGKLKYLPRGNQKGSLSTYLRYNQEGKFEYPRKKPQSEGKLRVPTKKKQTRKFEYLLRDL